MTQDTQVYAHTPTQLKQFRGKTHSLLSAVPWFTCFLKLFYLLTNADWEPLNRSSRSQTNCEQQSKKTVDKEVSVSFCFSIFTLRLNGLHFTGKYKRLQAQESRRWLPITDSDTYGEANGKIFGTHWANIWDSSPSAWFNSEKPTSRCSIRLVKQLTLIESMTVQT